MWVRCELGVHAPVATPSQIVQKLHSVFVDAVRDPKVQRMLSEQSMEPLGTSVEEINKAMKVQLEAARVVYKDINLKPND